VYVGVQDGRLADVIHQFNVDVNEQEIITAQVKLLDRRPCVEWDVK